MRQKRLASWLGIAASTVPFWLAAPAASQENELVVVLPEAPVTMDACNANNTANGRVTRINVYEPLTVIAAEGGMVEPRLATSWEQIDDLTWEFALRESVTFHDGAPFNADAVLKEMARTLSGERNCHTEQQYFRDFELSAEAVDDLTIRFTTDIPAPILPAYLSTLLISSPNAPVHDFATEPVGTGPYAFDSEQPGVDIRLVQNEDWWGEPSNVGAVRYIWREESVVRAAMVEVGEADLTPDIALQDATNPDLDVPYLDAETAWLRIDSEVPPLNDIRVRQALNYAIDRDAMLGTLFPIDSVKSAQPVGPAVLGYSEELNEELYGYDPERAMELLAEAREDGVPVEDEILLIGRTNIYSNSAESMEAMMAMFEAVGFNMELRMTEIGEWREYHNRPYADGRQPVIVQTKHDNNRGDAAFSLAAKYSCTGTNSAMCDEEIDQEMADAMAESGEERGPMMRAVLERIYREWVPDVYLYHMVTYARVGERITYEPNVLTGIEVRIEDVNFN